jgi:carboxyl-terminal processing protease
MSRVRAALAMLLVLGSGAACGEAFFGPEPSDDPETNFEILWREFDLHYAYFREKGVDWDGVFAGFRPRVHQGTNPRELFELASEMMALLRDGHVNLRAPGIGDWQYEDWWRGRPENYSESVVRGRYLGGSRTVVAGGHMYYGRLASGIGYLYIRDFQGSGWAGEIDRVLADLADAPALVIDIRNNDGGSDLLSGPIAGRFADRKRLAKVVRYRNGPGHDDFTDPIERFVKPEGPRQFGRPVAVLTNRRVFSTGEDFVLSLRVLPHVTVVGDTTGGGAGNPLGRELPNGWTFRVSRWNARTPEGLSYEGVGLPPDLPVWISAEDDANGRDTILEAAIAVLESSLARAAAERAWLP